MNKKTMTILPILAPMIAGMTDTTPSEPSEIVFYHKELVKSGITHKQPKPGKNKPAKGYNPETKTWEK